MPVREVTIRHKSTGTTMVVAEGAAGLYAPYWEVISGVTERPTPAELQGSVPGLGPNQIRAPSGELFDPSREVMSMTTPSAGLGQNVPITGWRDGQMRWDSTAPGGQGWVLSGGQWRPADQYGRVLPGYGPTMATIPPIGTASGTTTGVPVQGGQVNPVDLNIVPSAGPASSVASALNVGAVNQPIEIAEQRRRAFEDESEAGAFTRYMLGRQGATPWAQPVREAAQTRGALLSNLAPLLGYGGGNEGSFFDYYNRNFGNALPSREALNARLRDLTQASNVNPLEWSEQQRTTVAPFLDEKTGEFEQGRALSAQVAAAQARVNPSLRGAYEGLLRRLYREQQATTPENPWLSYAQSRELF